MYDLIKKALLAYSDERITSLRRSELCCLNLVRNDCSDLLCDFPQAIQYPNLLGQIQNSQERAALSERVSTVYSIKYRVHD